jgi:hypothetical protein
VLPHSCRRKEHSGVVVLLRVVSIVIYHHLVCLPWRPLPVLLSHVEQVRLNGIQLLLHLALVRQALVQLFLELLALLR